MKRLVFAIVIVSVIGSNIAFSQKNNDNRHLQKHEIKVNGFLFASSTVFDISYEYVANNSYGFGTSVLINAFNRDFPVERFSVTPFYRTYFFSKKDYGANGVFVESFLKLASVSNKNHMNYKANTTSNRSFFTTALGISIGRKWVNKRGFVLEAFLGMGRTLNSPKNSNVGILTRGGITIGKRF